MNCLSPTSINLASPNSPTAPAAPSGTASEDALKNTPVGRKLLKATQEFEANLISAWWEEAEKGLQDPMGGGMGSGFDGLKGLAMHTVAMGMVKSGGIGISRMIFHSLEPALRRKIEEQTGSSAEAKGSQQQALPANKSASGG